MKQLIMATCLSFLFVSCGDGADNRNENFGQIEAWWEENTDSLQANTEQGWENFKAEWKEMKAKVKREDLSEEDQREYDRMEEEVNRREQENQNRWEARQDNTEVAPDGLEKLLLGEAHDWNTVTGANLKDTYIRFMEQVRANDDNWTEAEWNAADAVFEKLQATKDRVDENMDTSDEAKIAALATEYRALETAADIDASVSNN